jgi:hypothetical protein
MKKLLVPTIEGKTRRREAQKFCCVCLCLGHCWSTRETFLYVPLTQELHFAGPNTETTVAGFTVVDVSARSAEENYRNKHLLGDYSLNVG